MAGTREASRHNITELFNQVVATYQGAIKIETNFPRWEEEIYRTCARAPALLLLSGEPGAPSDPVQQSDI